MYHGSKPNSPFRLDSMRIPADDFGYFSSNREYASGFASDPFATGEPKIGELHEACLVVKNPLVVDADKDWEAFNNRGFSRVALESQGYDGIVMTIPPEDGEPSEMIVGVFTVAQIIPAADMPGPIEEWAREIPPKVDDLVRAKEALNKSREMAAVGIAGP
jgi:hypothetical protein